MTDRAAALREWLEDAERRAAGIVADKRLPEMRDFQPDHAWKTFFSDAIDPARHRRDFDNVRWFLQLAESGGIEADAALDKAEGIRRRFDNIVRYLAQAEADWHRTAQLRRARKLRKERAGWQRAVAHHLASNVGGTKKQQWEAIPERSPGLMIRFEGDEIEVSRDGDHLVCEVGGSFRRVAFSTFFDTYLRKSRAVSG